MSVINSMNVVLESHDDLIKSGKLYSAFSVLLKYIDDCGEEALNQRYAISTISKRFVDMIDNSKFGPTYGVLSDPAFKPCKQLKNFEVAHFLRHVDFCSDEGRAEAVDSIRDRILLIEVLLTNPAVNTDEDGVMSIPDYAEWISDVASLYFDESVSYPQGRIKNMVLCYAACASVLATLPDVVYDSLAAQALQAKARHALAIWSGC